MSELYITSKEDERSGEVLLTVKGDITAGARKEAAKLIRIGENLARQFPTPTGVKLDLASVGQIDSMGMGTLLNLHMILRSVGTPLSIANANEHIRKSLSVAALDRQIIVEGAD